MDWLEDELRKALARENPPPGFADRVIGRARGKLLRMPRWYAAAAAAALVVATAGAYGYRWHEGMEAKREVMMAMRLASVKVNRVQTAVKESAR